jgi:excisionase family DNA binding protein
MRLVQAKRASEVLSVSLARLYELARLGVIPVVRLGPRQIRFDEDALTEWVKNGGLAVEGNGSARISDMTRGRSSLAAPNQASGQ